MTPTDHALVERVANGDARALGEFMSRYGPPLMRFATHYLHSAPDADEVLQDVFLRAERAIRRGARPDRTDAWLFRIAINRCRSRQRRWWPFVSGAAAEQVIERTANGVADGDRDAAWREEIDAALEQLTPPLREAFLLKHVEGMEYQEMMTITGASLSALKMRVARACEQLRGHLAEVRHA